MSHWSSWIHGPAKFIRDCSSHLASVKTAKNILLFCARDCSGPMANQSPPMMSCSRSTILIRDGWANASYRDTLSQGSVFPDVTKVDDLTIRVRTKQPFAPFLSGLTGLPMAPKHAMLQIRKQPRAAFVGFWDINSDPCHNGDKRTIQGEALYTRSTCGDGAKPILCNGRQTGQASSIFRPLRLSRRARSKHDASEVLRERIGHSRQDAVRGTDAALMKQREPHGNFKMYNLGATMS